MSNSLTYDRSSPSASFASESSEEDIDDQTDDDEQQSEVTLPSGTTNKSSLSSKSSTPKLNSALMKSFALQTRASVFRSTSLSPLAARKAKQQTYGSTNLLNRPSISTTNSSLTTNITVLNERKAPPPPSSPKLNTDRQQQQQVRSKNTTPNEKSSATHLTTSNNSSRNPTISQVPVSGRSSSFNMHRDVVPLNEHDLNRFYQSVLEQMHQLTIRYPNKSDEETRRVYSDIHDNWNKYRNSIGEFWSTRLDTRKRQAIIKIVRNNVQQIIKQLWAYEQPTEQLSLNRHFTKLEQRLLANNGQYLWEICQSRYNSWESSLGKTTSRLTPIELACCHRFVELSKQALFIVYRYSIDEKVKRQKHQQQQQQQTVDESSIMVVS